MNKRFEKIIATALLTGSLTLAGCDAASNNSEDGTPGTQPDPQTPDAEAPTLVLAETVDPTTILLRFTEPVTVGDPAQALAMFTVGKNKLNYGMGFPPKIYTSSYYYSSSIFTLPVAPYYSFASAGQIGAVTALQVDSNDATLVTLTLNTPIQNADSDGTGMLRLSYTGGAGGIGDEAGNALVDIALTNSDKGNVLDKTGNPVLIAARTIDSQTIELVFNEPVTLVGTAADLAAKFLISKNGIGYIRWCIYSYGPSAFRDAVFPGMSVYGTASSYSYYPNPMLSYFMNTSTGSPTPKMAYGTNISITAEEGLRAYLTVVNPNAAAIPIPDDYDHEGFLRLYYLPQYISGSASLEDGAGNPLSPVNPSRNHRGNVVDTLGANGNNKIDL